MIARVASDGLALRPARDDEADRAFLYRLFAATRAPDMAVMPIDDAAKDYLLRAQYRAMTETYARDFPRARSEIVEVMGKRVGRLITDVSEDCVTYVDIALLPEAQGRGHATRFMTFALQEPRRLSLPARATALAANAASLRLWDRLGFRRVDDSPPFVRLEWRP